MTNVVTWLRGIRASNLIFLAPLPILIFLIATSRNYGPALAAVLGIEDNASSLFVSFLTAAAAMLSGVSGVIMILRSMRPDQEEDTIYIRRRWAVGLFGLQALCLAAMAFMAATDAYVVSIAVNSYDPRTVDWIIIQNRSFVLEPAFQVQLLATVRHNLWLLALASAATGFFAFLPRTLHISRIGRLIWVLLFCLNFAGAFYILMVAHPGFAVGIMVTLRAAVFAYLGAAILGLLWALLKGLKPSRRAPITFACLGAILVAIGLFYAFQPHEKVELVGTLEGRIGIVSGTPQSLADTVRFGDFLAEKPDKAFKIRSLATSEQALDLMSQGLISAALLPKGARGDYPVIWSSSYLAGSKATIATTSIVLGVFLVLLSAVGAFIKSHPLTVFSDFFVDTIRGVPMLVIILYVGLPLAGALKDASAGYIDIQMMTRGVIAIAFGYSAYMAEIFRAGIEAIPKGQIEAARTLGLREYQVARFVIVPQAIAIVLPALGNEFIAMLKDTSLLSILSVRDITQRMREFQAQSFQVFEPFNSAALVYLVLTLVAASGIKALDGIVNKARSHDNS